MSKKNASPRYTWPFPALWTRQAFQHLSPYLSYSLCGFLKFFCNTDLDNKNNYLGYITLNLYKNAFIQAKYDHVFGFYKIIDLRNINYKSIFIYSAKNIKGIIYYVIWWPLYDDLYDK